MKSTILIAVLGRLGFFGVQASQIHGHEAAAHRAEVQAHDFAIAAAIEQGTARLKAATEAEAVRPAHDSEDMKARKAALKDLCSTPEGRQLAAVRHLGTCR